MPRANAILDAVLLLVFAFLMLAVAYVVLHTGPQ